jgi:lipoprotein-releasing system ATP-binding protein
MLIATNVSKTYASRGGVAVLEDVSLTLDRGQSVAIMGPSGSGKSTLLYLLGALEPPSSGTVELDGRNPYTMGEQEQARFRSEHVGFIFQDHLLLPQLSALDNVLVPTLAGAPDGKVDFRQRARDLLVDVGLEPRLAHRPAELSGGERQRVAIARALVRQPSLLLCDEPTGNLDRAAAEHVADLLVSLHQRRHTMLVVVTHSAALASRFDRRFELIDRRLQSSA